MISYRPKLATTRLYRTHGGVVQLASRSTFSREWIVNV